MRTQISTLPCNFLCQYEGTHTDTIIDSKGIIQGIITHTGSIYIPKGEIAVNLYDDKLNWLPSAQFSVWLTLIFVAYIAWKLTYRSTYKTNI